MQITLIIIGLVLMIVPFLIMLRKLRNGQQEYKTLLSQKKRSEVNLGYIVEKLAPFLKNFGDEYDSKNLTFLGKPIDYLHFGEDKITFIEVKSGNSRLTKSQRKIKHLIKAGKVTWHEVRVKKDKDVKADAK